MTKKDLIDELKYELVISSSEATKAVDVVIRLIEEALSRGESVKIRGFGNFHVRDRAAHSYTLKSADNVITKEACKRIQFRPTERLMGLIQPGTAASTDAGVDE